MSRPPTAAQDLADELALRWDELHKKSMVTVLVLVGLTERPMWSKELAEWLAEVSGWDLGERSMHRTLKRMAEAGLVAYQQEAVPRTGAARKTYALTEAGQLFLGRVSESSLRYLADPEVVRRMRGDSA